MSASDPTRRSTRRDRLVWGLGVFAVALLLRAVQLWQLEGSVMADMILGDAKNYDTHARTIAGGDWIGSEVFYQAPLYSYFLAVVYRFLGDAPVVVRAVQTVLGAASCAFLVQAGWRFFGKRAGIAAGLLLAFYAPAIFFDSMLQKACLDVLLVCAMLWILSEIDARRGPGLCLGLGVSLGVLVLSRENALVFGLVLLGWLLWLPGAARGRRAVYAAGFAAGVALVLLPVALRNWSVSGDFHLTTSQLGHNFYIGNNEAADGTYKPLLVARGDPRVEIQDAIDLAERISDHSLSRAEVSDFYLQRGLDFIRAQPGAWLALTWRKLCLAFNRVELVDTEDQYTHAEESVVLRMTGWVMHFGVLAPLALLGIVATWGRRARLLPLYLLFLFYGAGMLVFYVFARYRMPLVPLLVLFAAAGLAALPRLVRERSRPRLAAVAAGLLAFAIFCNWPLTDEDRMRSVTHFNVGNELAARDRLDEAIAHYREAIALYGGNALANHNLGAVLAGRGDLVRARTHLERALEIAPGYDQARANLARVHADLGLAQLAAGETGRAEASFREALRLEPGLVEAQRALERLSDGG